MKLIAFISLFVLIIQLQNAKANDSYFLTTRRMTFTQAETYCFQRNAHLVTIDTEEKYQEVTDFVRNYFNKKWKFDGWSLSFYTGMEYKVDDKSVRMADGTKAYTNWYPITDPFPLNWRQYNWNKVLIHISGKKEEILQGMRNRPATYRRFPLCQYNDFFLSDFMMNLDQSEAFCREKDGKLVTIENLEKYSSVTNFVRNYFDLKWKHTTKWSLAFFTGMKYTVHDYRSKLPDGSEGYTRWYPIADPINLEGIYQNWTSVLLHVRKNENDIKQGMRNRPGTYNRYPLCEYETTCPGDLIFQFCGSSCPNECSRNNSQCKEKCTPGCQCPKGKWLINKNKCVNYQQCSHSGTVPAWIRNTMRRYRSRG